ncbi:hypothetical protein [Streptomyces sp. NPDC047976]|uniref:hypothetical protein n=1 Tax=unclassified Streptomyces TaxID=2593676 RepID=UPI00341BA359
MDEGDVYLDVDERCTPGMYGPKGTRPGYAYRTDCEHVTKCGWLYIVEFSDGVIKVGRTADARERIKRHGWDARRRGAEIGRWWISVKHSNVDETERVMKQCCLRHWKLFDGDEYFADADFDMAVTYAMFFKYARPCKRELLRQVLQGGV